MALALATLITWLLVALAIVVLGRLRQVTEWEPWNVLRGVRAPAVTRLSDSLSLRMGMVRTGYDCALRARAAGHAEAHRRLSLATLQTTRVLVRQLDEELEGYAQHARVLQAAVTVEPLRVVELRHADLQGLARGERAVAMWFSPVGRLRLHLWTLRRGLRLLGHRCDVGVRPGGADTLVLAADVQADLAAIARATVNTYQALLLSLDQSRRRITVDNALPSGPH